VFAIFLQLQPIWNSLLTFFFVVSLSFSTCCCKERNIWSYICSQLHNKLMKASVWLIGHCTFLDWKANFPELLNKKYDWGNWFCSAGRHSHRKIERFGSLNESEDVPILGHFNRIPFSDVMIQGTSGDGHAWEKSNKVSTAHGCIQIYVKSSHGNQKIIFYSFIHLL
jgi:hypothetical protein